MPAFRRKTFRLAPLGVLSDVALFLPLGTGINLGWQLHVPGLTDVVATESRILMGMHHTSVLPKGTRPDGPYSPNLGRSDNQTGAGAMSLLGRRGNRRRTKCGR